MQFISPAAVPVDAQRASRSWWRGSPKSATTSSPARLSCCRRRFAGCAPCRRLPGVSPKAVLPYLEKCVKEQGFVGCLINPDPGECGGGAETPPLGDRFWYPLYEKLVELDIPGHIHSTALQESSG